MRIIKADWITHNGGGIYSVDAHPDGSRLATGGSDNAVRIWAINPVTSKVDVKAIKIGPIEQKGDRSSSSGGGSSGRSNGIMTVAAAAALARGDLLNPIHEAGKTGNGEKDEAATTTADDEVDDFRTTNDSSAGPLRLATLTKHSGGVNIVRWSTDGTTVSVVGFFMVVQEKYLCVHLLA